MRTMIFASLVSASLLAGGAAHADDDATPTWQVRSGMTTRWLRAPSAAVLTTDAMTGFAAAADRELARVDLGLGPFDALELTGELGFERAAADGTTFDQLDNELRTWMFTAGARARLPVWSWLHVGGRVHLDAGKTTIRIADMRMATNAIEDGGGFVGAGAGVGLTLLPRLSPPRSGAFFMGVEVELGYQVATTTEVRAQPQDRPPEELTIPAVYASLGDVDLRGTTLRISATIGF